MANEQKNPAARGRRGRVKASSGTHISEFEANAISPINKTEILERRWYSDIDLGYGAGHSFLAQRPDPGEPVRLKAGDRYLLHVWRDGLEQVIACPPAFNDYSRTSGVLDVTVKAITEAGILEEVRTRTVELAPVRPAVLRLKIVEPRGGGWELFDDSSDNYSTWHRLRNWEVVA
jgi:hypothetical protein